MTVVTNDYLNLQKEIIQKQETWTNELLNDLQYNPKILINDNVPLIEKTDNKIELDKYEKFALELIDFLKEVKPDLATELDKLKIHLDSQTLLKWTTEVLAFNHYYFSNFATENGVAEWLPHFIAEHAIRPYLRALSQTYQKEIYESDPLSICPCCGEPIRLARLEGKVGRKIVHCPRCYANWNEKRSVCSHCGQDHSTGLHYLHIEDNKKLQIHICEECNGYVKVIDTRSTIKQENPAIQDLNTIHLDILAQEKGYGIPKVNDRVN